MNQDFPLEELRAQLEQARAADPECKMFGARSHRYQWNPPASEKEVEDFEQKIGVTLPQEYRDFLLQAGNGGAGPFYGLSKIGSCEGWEVEPELPPLLCPETSSADTSEEDWNRGCIIIGGQGDTYFTCLMVTGPYRGRVVYVEYEGSWIFFPKEPDFLSWYQRWLREVCNHYNIFWFGTNLDGNEQELQNYYDQAETEEEKLDVISSMEKFPTLSPASVEFLKNALWARRGSASIKGFLPLALRIDRDFFHRLLESRWQTGLYEAAVEEIGYCVFSFDDEKQYLVKAWWKPVLEKLREIPQSAWLSTMEILEASKEVSLKQVGWLLDEASDSKIKQELVDHFSRFPDAAQHPEIWVKLLEDRQDLELLRRAIITAPVVADQQLMDCLMQLQQDFAFAVGIYLPKDANDDEEMDQFMLRTKQEYVYKEALCKWKDLWHEQINPQVEGIPRPYRLQLNFFNSSNMAVGEPAPPNGIPIHPMVALAIQQIFHHLPTRKLGWELTLGKIKQLTLRLTDKTVNSWNEKKREAEICGASEFPPPKPFYYDMEGWSIIGRMPKLKSLTISQICVEDFSFLAECTSVEKLSLCNTNFTDCRLLLQMPSLKSVDLRQCPLQHTEVLESAPFACCVKEDL